MLFQTDASVEFIYTHAQDSPRQKGKGKKPCRSDSFSSSSSSLSVFSNQKQCAQYRDEHNKKWNCFSAVFERR